MSSYFIIIRGSRPLISSRKIWDKNLCFIKFDSILATLKAAVQPDIDS